MARSKKGRNDSAGPARPEQPEDPAGETVEGSAREVPEAAPGAAERDPLAEPVAPEETAEETPEKTAAGEPIAEPATESPADPLAEPADAEKDPLAEEPLGDVPPLEGDGTPDAKDGEVPDLDGPAEPAAPWGAPADPANKDDFEMPEEAESPSAGTAGGGDGTPPSPPVPATTQPPRRGGAGALLLGGVIAAVLGAGAMVLAQQAGWLRLGGPSEETLARIEALESALASATAELEGARGGIEELRAAEPDFSGITGAIEEVRAEAEAAATANEDLRAQLAETDARLREVAVQQIPEAELPQAISEAYDAKLEDLLATLDARFEDMQAGLDQRMTELEGVQTAAAEAEAEARAAARLAEARSALAEVRAALDSGAAYADPLEQVAALGDVQVPAPLAEHAEEGVPTLDTLRETFPDSARAALDRATRAAAEAGELGWWETVTRTQLGVRSLEAREGDDPDAVLSRAEDALRRGDLAAALDELDALPTQGREPLADWETQAEIRLATLAAAAELSAQLEQTEDR